MIDYEDLILQRQEARDLEDDCPELTVYELEEDPQYIVTWCYPQGEFRDEYTVRAINALAALDEICRQKGWTPQWVTEYFDFETRGLEFARVMACRNQFYNPIIEVLAMKKGDDKKC